MKKIFITTLSLFLLLSVSVQAQGFEVTVDIADVTDALPGYVLIPVIVDFSNTNDGVCAFDLTISFDENVLTEFYGVANVHDDVDINDIEFKVGNVGPTDGQIKISFAKVDANLTTNDTLFEMEFEYAGGYSDITFEDIGEAGVTEVGDCESVIEQIDAEFINGSISQFIPPVPLNNWVIYLSMGLILSFFVLDIRKML